MRRLFNVLLVELSNERSLNSSTAGGEFRGINGNGGGGRGIDGGGGGEDLGEAGGDLWGMRGATGEDNLVFVTLEDKSRGGSRGTNLVDI